MKTTTKQQNGLNFESYIMDWFAKEKNINLSHYTTYQEQIDKGENRQGFEIKNDQMFKKTGNVSIIQFAIPLIEFVISKIANPTINKPINFSTAPKYLRNFPANLRKGLINNAATMNGNVKPKPNTNNRPIP